MGELNRPGERALTDHERTVLDIESKHWTVAAQKEAAIRALGETPITFAQTVARLLDDEAALAYAPMTVARLRRTMDERRR